MASRYAASLVWLFALFISAHCNHHIQTCTEYVYVATPVTAVSIYYYSYSCGWNNWSTCYGSAYYTTYSTTYSISEQCCTGYSGDDLNSCFPVCNVPCGTNQECTMPETCACIEGWTGSNCLTDINECAILTDVCEYRETCVNNAGSYDCACPDYDDLIALDGRRCISPVTNLVGDPEPREIKLTWEHPVNLSADGTFDHYEIICTADDNTTAIAETIDTIGWVEEYTVEPLTPYTNYLCSVTAMTTGNGGSKPVVIWVQTDQDTPDGPPLNLNVYTIDSMILEITWDIPAVPNGEIEKHKLYIDYTNSSNIYEILVNPAYTIFLLEFLYPHQLVGISVSAITGGGEGPSSAKIFNRTAEAEPGRVSDISVEIISDNAAELYWNAPESLNGIILSYHICLYKVENGNWIEMECWDREYDDELLVKVFYLLPSVPYQFVVVGATIAGLGEIAPFQFFTREDVPHASPTISASSRISADEIYITWSDLNADELQGFFVDYVVKYYTTAVHTDCSSPMDEVTETTTIEYIRLQNLDPHTAYCVKVAASTTQGTGVYSEFVFVDEFDNSKFEFHLYGVHDCPAYVLDDESSVSKLTDIAEQLTDVLNNMCKCNVQNSYIGELRFVCADDEDDDRVILQGSVVGTAGASSMVLVQHLEEWKVTSPHFVIQGLKVYVNESCPVALDSYDTHTQCVVELPNSQKGTEDSVNISNVVGGVVGAGIAVIVIVIVALVVVIAVILIRRSSGKAVDGQVVYYDTTKRSSQNCVTNPIGDGGDGGNDYDDKELLKNMN